MATSFLNALPAQLKGLNAPALEFIACGSVDDGKSTLIGRLLLDAGGLPSDQLERASRLGAPDLASFTDGLIAEREQGITIDVARRYFRSARRGFVLADAPGHDRHTRNMATGCSCAHAAVVIVDAAKIDWGRAPLLEQTRRHVLIARLMRVPSLLFAVNKLDLAPDPSVAFPLVRASIESFCASIGAEARAVVPASALLGWNVVHRAPQRWAGYAGPSLLEILEELPSGFPELPDAPFAMPIQWTQRLDEPPAAGASRRLLWGRVARGTARTGMELEVYPSGERAHAALCLDRVRSPGEVSSGWSAGIGLDREVDASRGDWILERSELGPQRSARLLATVIWLSAEPMFIGREYWALHGRSWIRARVTRLLGEIDLSGLGLCSAQALRAGGAGRVELVLHEPIPFLPYEISRAMGSMILVDPAGNDTAAALLLEGPA